MLRLIAMNVTGIGLFLFIFMLPLVCIAKQRSNLDLCQSDQFVKRKSATENSKSGHSKRIDYQIVARYPHDTSAFTQGLVFYKQNLYESTGLLGKSEVRKINLIDGKVLAKTQLSDIYFGEGLAQLNHQLVQMSWKSGKVFFFHADTLALTKKMYFDKEVWGSTSIDEKLLISNGTSYLLFIGADNLNIKKTMKVTLNNKEVTGLNELEYAGAYVYANVWPSHCIVKINPENGKVVAWLNLSKLYPDPDEHSLPDSAVLNGIAYDQQKRHFFVTGKFWPYLYEIKLQLNED